MGYLKKVYAIYPFNDCGEIAGVYIGSTLNIKERMAQHLFSPKNEVGKQGQMHELMIRNGYKVQIIDVIHDYWGEANREYDWIDFCEKNTDLKIFNTRMGKTYEPNHKRIAFHLESESVQPVFVNGEILWRIK